MSSDPGPAGSGQPDQQGRAGEQAPQAPTCYRHPGRETYVSCARCGRYACPDCMRSASVGQQCVDCVGQGAQATRSARTVFGGPAHGVAAGEWYRLITSAFLAPATGLNGLGFLDILFNMWALIFVGPALEGFLGRLRFLSVYLLSAVGGSVMFYYLAPPNAAAVGASGAIFGLFGAWFVVSRRLRLDTRPIAALIAI